MRILQAGGKSLEEYPQNAVAGVERDPRVGDRVLIDPVADERTLAVSGRRGYDQDRIRTEFQQLPLEVPSRDIVVNDGRAVKFGSASNCWFLF